MDMPIIKAFVNNVCVGVPVNGTLIILAPVTNKGSEFIYMAASVINRITFINTKKESKND